MERLVMQHDETLYGNEKRGFKGLVKTDEAQEWAIDQLMKEVVETKNAVKDTKNEMKTMQGQVLTIVDQKFDILIDKVGSIESWKSGIQGFFDNIFSWKNLGKTLLWLLKIGIVLAVGTGAVKGTDIFIEFVKKIP